MVAHGMMPRSRLPRNLNQQSGRSILDQQHLLHDGNLNDENGVGDEDDEDNNGGYGEENDDEGMQDEYGDETNQERKDGIDLSNVDSIERLNGAGGRNGKNRLVNNTDMQHYAARGGKMSSLDGSALRRRPYRARSTIQGNYSS